MWVQFKQLRLAACHLITARKTGIFEPLLNSAQAFNQEQLTREFLWLTVDYWPTDFAELDKHVRNWSLIWQSGSTFGPIGRESLRPASITVPGDPDKWKTGSTRRFQSAYSLPPTCNTPNPRSNLMEFTTSTNLSPIKISLGQLLSAKPLKMALGKK